MRRPTPTAPGGLRQLTVIARTARRMPCTDSLTSRRKAAVHSSCAVAKRRAAYAAAAAGGFGRSKGVHLVRTRVCACVCSGRGRFVRGFSRVAAHRCGRDAVGGSYIDGDWKRAIETLEVRSCTRARLSCAVCAHRAGEG